MMPRRPDAVTPAYCGGVSLQLNATVSCAVPHFGYTPMIEPWPIEPNRHRADDTYRELHDYVDKEDETAEEQIFPEVDEAVKARVDAESKESYNRYKDFIYSDYWGEEDVQAIRVFLRRLGVGSFVVLYILFGMRWSDRVSEKVELPLVYDPEGIAKYFRLRPEQVLFRAAYIAIEAFNFSAGSSWDEFLYKRTKNVKNLRRRVASALHRLGFGKANPGAERLRAAKETERSEAYWSWRFQRRASLLRESLTKLGPVFVKLGQLLATRPDIVGEKMVMELQRLQDDIPFFPNRAAFQFIREELGADPDRVFEQLTKTPVAAASLGQVYKASLDGAAIAVKVQRPGIVEQIALDSHILRRAGRFLGRYMRSKSDPAVLIDEFAMRLFEELDYVQESHNMARFRTLYGGIEGIYVPRVFESYSTRHVLVMEWVDGTKLVNDSKCVKPEDIPQVEVGIRCALTQLLEVGFLHADPHAGNLIKTKGGLLAYLDFGLVSIVPELVRNRVLCALLHLINREYELLAEDFAALSVIKAYEIDLELSEFSKALMDEFEPLVSRGIQNFTFIGIAEKLLSLSTQFPLVFPSYFVNNMRAVATLEGLALSADNKYKIFKIIYPYVAKRVLYDSTPMLKQALSEMVVSPEGTIRWDRLEHMIQDAEVASRTSSRGGTLLGGGDSLLEFVASPGGRPLRRLFVAQLVDDADFRLQRSIDKLEKFILPPPLQPPARCIGLCVDVQYMLTLKENRRRAHLLLSRMRSYKARSFMRLIPLIIANAAVFAFFVCLRVAARLVVDLTFVVKGLWKNLNVIARARQNDVAKAAAVARRNRASGVRGAASAAVAAIRNPGGPADTARSAPDGGEKLILPMSEATGTSMTVPASGGAMAQRAAEGKAARTGERRALKGVNKAAKGLEPKAMLPPVSSSAGNGAHRLGDADDHGGAVSGAAGDSSSSDERNTNVSESYQGNGAARGSKAAGGNGVPPSSSKRKRDRSARR